MARIDGTTGRNSSHWRYFLMVTEKDVEIIENTSKVVVEVYLGATSYSRAVRGNVSATHTINVNGKDYEFKTGAYTIEKNTDVKLGEITSDEIEHTSDGSKTISISASSPDLAQASGYGAYSGTASGTVSLTKILRQSKIESFSGNDIEKEFLVTYTAYSSDYINKLRLSVPGVKILETFNYSSGTKFKLSESSLNYLFSYMKNSNKINLGAVIETWSGTTKIGESDELAIECYISNANPICGSFTYKDTNSTTIAVTKNNQRIVRNLSNLKVDVGTATALKSATISKYQVTINGITKETTSAGTIDFGTINASNNLTAVLKVVDSRGNSSSVEKTIIVDDWSLPFAIITLNRLNNYEDETYLTVDGSCSSVNNKNALEIKYQYKKVEDETYCNLIDIEDNVKVTLSVLKEFAWNFRIIVADKFGTTTYNYILAKGIPIMFIDTNNLGVGIDCFPNGNGLYVKGNEYLDYEIVDEW